MPGRQITICKGQPIPKGWAVVCNTHTDACNGAAQGVYLNAVVIEDFSFYPIGSQVDICKCGIIPDGWVIVGNGPHYDCCNGFAAGVPQNSLTVRRVR